jgi:hypothetical protein
MKCQPARRLTSYTPRPIAKLTAPAVEAIAGLVHKRAVNNRTDRGSATAVFIDSEGGVFAFCADSLTADLWMRDRFDHLLAVLDPGRPDYSLGWLQATLRAHVEAE